MELTEENQDYMDCRPPRETGIPTPPEVQAMIDARKAKLAARSAKPIARAAE
jgi:hypothetical protein